MVAMMRLVALPSLLFATTITSAPLIPVMMNQAASTLILNVVRQMSAILMAVMNKRVAQKRLSIAMMTMFVQLMTVTAILDAHTRK